MRGMLWKTFLVLLWSLLTDGSHFRGAIIMMRPVPTNTTGKLMEVYFRISWRRDSEEGGGCTQETISQGTLIESRTLECLIGCAGQIGSMRYKCTDFSITENWSYGEGKIVYEFAPDVSQVSLQFSGTAWISPFGGSWSIPISMSMAVRRDTGSVNSSPQAITSPVVRVQANCNHTIRIHVSDPDYDVIKCRWARGSSECGSVCSRFPGAELDSDTCVIQFSAGSAEGYNVAALIVEDFLHTSTLTVPLSSVALQFLVLVYASYQPCSQMPGFRNPTLFDRECTAIPAGATYKSSLVAHSGGDGVSIVEFETVSPPGFQKGDIEALDIGANTYITSITWTPEQDDFNGIHMFCFTAVNSIRQSSEQRCAQFMPGHNPPVLLSIMPNDEKVHPRDIVWTLQFDKVVQRSPRPSKINFYDAETNRLVYAVDTSVSAEITINETAVTISPSVTFPEKRTIYVISDRGIFVGVEGCLPIFEPSPGIGVLTFTTLDITPPELEFAVMPSVYTSGNVTVTWTSNEPITSNCSLIHMETGMREQQSCVDDRWVPNQSLLEGVYELEVTAVDEANNSAIQRQRFEVDRTAPLLHLIEMPPNITNQNHRRNTFRFSCPDESCKFSLRVAPVAPDWVKLSYANAGQIVSYTLPSMIHDQEYVFEVVPTDRANNDGEKITFAGKVDKMPPSLSLAMENVTVTCATDIEGPIPAPTATDENGLKEPPSYTDREFPCYLKRTWTAEDVTGNVGSIGQNIIFDGGLKINSIPSITVLCDSSIQPLIVSVPADTASASSQCFTRNTPVTLMTADSVSSEQYSCPGTFARILTARNTCTGETKNSTQTIAIYDICPSDACGRDKTPARGICVLGKCKCNKPWYGNNCETEILDPIIVDAEDDTTEEGRDYHFNITLLQGSQPLTWRLVQGPARMKVDSLTGVLSWTRSVAGTNIISVEAKNAVGSHQISWILHVNYTYSAVLRQTNATILPFAAPVILSGTVTYQINSYIKQLLGSVVPVDVKIIRNSFVTTLRAFTKTDGSFAVLYSPPSTHYGHYVAFAKHPSASDAPGQVEWDTLGMSTFPQILQLEGEAVSNFTKLYPASCIIVNDGPRTLTELTVQVQYAEQLRQRGLEVTVKFQDRMHVDSLPTDANVTLDILVNAQQAIHSIFNIIVRSKEGTERMISVNLDIAQINPKLVIEPTSLNIHLLRGVYKSAEFSVTNHGKIPANNMRVKLPLNAILMLQSFGSVNQNAILSPGHSTVLALQAYAKEDHPLGDIRGSFIVASEETETQVPFTIAITSNLELNFMVKVEDEYTYFAAGKPLVKGAQVRLVNYIREIDIVQYTDNLTGITTFANIVEDKYDLYVQAPNHRSVKHTVLPSTSSSEHTVFMERTAVTYSFSVTPVQIEDSYELEIEADFETRVPLPVVTVTPNDIDLEPYELGYEDTIEFNVTNHGLIRSDNIQLNLPSNHPFLSFEIQSDSFGALEAESSIIIPVHVRRKTLARRVPVVWVLYGANIIYSYLCGDLQFRMAPIIFTRQKLLATDSFQLPSPPQFPPCTLCVGGGGVSGPVFSFDEFTVSFPNLCNKCIQSLFCLVKTPNFLGAGCIPLVAGGTAPSVDSVAGILGWIDCNLPLPFPINFLNLAIYLELVEGKNKCGYISIIKCACDILINCFGVRSVSEAVDALLDGLTPIMINAAFALEVLGDEKWFHVGDSDWANNILKPALSDTSDGNYYITSHEMQTILNAQTPNGVTNADVRLLVERLNNTISGWNSGQFEPSPNDNFASFGKVTQMLNDIHDFNEKAKSRGFISYLEAYNHAANEINKLESWEEEAGVCAVVRIQLKQQVALTREAFLVALEIDNKEENMLIDIGVDLTITEVATGEIATVKFSIGKPTLGLEMRTGQNGTWTLSSESTGRIEWLLVPYSEAAPMSDVLYDVGGILTYQSGVDLVEVPLLPSRITVKPDPSLRVHYFWEKYVEADDPFTDEVEKSVPFSLGVVMKNEGYGSANNIRLSSSQPEIIENEKGLKISFRIIGSAMNDQPRQPSLDVTIGDLHPNKTVSVRWWMVSSLQGQFKNYSASFRNVNPLGDENLSLLDELKIHDLIRNVRLHGDVEDDNILDFLVNDRKDLDEVPEVVYDSHNLEAYPVFHGNLAHISTGVEDSQDSQTSKITVKAVSGDHGWNYYRLSDHNGLYGLFGGYIVGITKDSNTEVPLDNVWLKRHAEGNPRTIYHSLHIFDWATDANATRHYEVLLCTSNCTFNGNASIITGFKDPLDIVEVKHPDTTVPSTPAKTTVETVSAGGLLKLDIVVASLALFVVSVNYYCSSQNQ